MKVFRLILLLSALTIVGCTDMALTTNTEDTNSRQLESRNVRTPFFEFPVIQWEILETHEQKLAACEIPDSILSKIPTKDLVEICMKYPLLLDAYAFNTPLQGIKTVISRFNGFKELMNRKDNCIYIFDYLKRNDMKNKDLSQLKQIEVGRLTLVYALAEYVLSLDSVLSNATEGMKNEIASFVIDIIEWKEAKKSYHALGSLTSSAYLWASILFSCSKSRSVNPIIDDFLKGGMILNKEQYLKIKQQCQSFN